ncbi:unnamed protein product [Cercospora beticola]|nr:unnamed protein product [Cercospora beticola]
MKPCPARTAPNMPATRKLLADHSYFSRGEHGRHLHEIPSKQRACPLCCESILLNVSWSIITGLTAAFRGSAYDLSPEATTAGLFDEGNLRNQSRSESVRQSSSMSTWYRPDSTVSMRSFNNMNIAISACRNTDRSTGFL